MTGETTALHEPNCIYCGNPHFSSTVCPRVSAIEYHPDGTTKRVEFHEPETFIDMVNKARAGRGGQG